MIEPSDTERPEWPDATRAYVEALESENAHLAAHVCRHGQSSERGGWECPVTLMEAAANGKYWQMAKGKVRKGEPLYGAAVIEPATNKIIAIGEADTLPAAIASMQPATER